MFEVVFHWGILGDIMINWNAIFPLPHWFRFCSYIYSRNVSVRLHIQTKYFSWQHNYSPVENWVYMYLENDFNTTCSSCKGISWNSSPNETAKTEVFCHRRRGVDISHFAAPLWHGWHLGMNEIFWSVTLDN